MDPILSRTYVGDGTAHPPCGVFGAFPPPAAPALPFAGPHPPAAPLPASIPTPHTGGPLGGLGVLTWSSETRSITNTHRSK